jgi:hypothetical protein
MSLDQAVQEAQAGARERRIRELEADVRAHQKSAADALDAQLVLSERLARARLRMLQWSTQPEACDGCCPNSRHLYDLLTILTEEG